MQWVKMEENETYSRLLALPWELRRRVIIQVQQHGRELPCFNREFIESRVRLRNCFDANYPELTNFYVPRHKYGYENSRGLQATNRQLREETKQVVEEELKSGNFDGSFVLDVMIVKDIGVFPNWISFPYRPEHLKRLTVNLRIIRVGTSTVPDEWVELATYKDENYWQTYWQLLMAVVMYALGVFSVKQDPELPRVESNIQLPPVDESIMKEITDNMKDIQLASESHDPNSQPDLRGHHSEVFDAYRLPTASWITDELFIHFDDFEYDVNNERIPLVPGCKEWRYYDPIPPGSVEIRKNGRFYKDGCIQFGRDVFRDYDLNRMYADEVDECNEFVAKGMFAGYQLENVLTEILCGVGCPEVYESPQAPYLQLLSHNVGCISTPGAIRPEVPIVERYPCFWLFSSDGWEYDCQNDDGYYHDETIERNLARELARDPPDETHILLLRIMKSRRTNGWILDSDG